MTELSRWSLLLLVDWRPTLTFARRRLELLDWFEANVEVAAFTTDDERVGIAVTSEDRRLMVYQSGLHVELRSPSAEPEAVLDALVGIWEVMQPHRPTVRLCQTVWSVPVEIEYEEARTALAKRTTGDLAETGIHVLDCANLVDLHTENALATVEFGIVSKAELAMRLQNPRARSCGSSYRTRPPRSPSLQPTYRMSLSLPRWRGSHSHALSRLRPSKRSGVRSTRRREMPSGSS